MTIRGIFRLHKILWFRLLLLSVISVLTYNAYAHAEDTEEWIPDANLRQAVREALELPAEEPLIKEKMRGFDFLNAHNKGISDITGLEFATNLRELDLSRNPITDLRPLSSLITLEGLHLWRLSPNTPTLELHPLATLANLAELNLGNSRVLDISSLSGLKKLQHLHLIHNHIADVSPLATLTELRTLWLEGNPINDLTPLGGLNLRKLDLSSTSITDLRPLATLINLESLFLPENGISDISPLSGLTELRELHLSDNNIEDLHPLSALTELRILWIQKNPIIDFSPLVGLNLTDLKYDVMEDPTGQTDPAEAWMPDAALRIAVRGEIGLLPGVPLTKEKLQAANYINVAGKGISDITGLEFATHLRELDISNNPITDLRPLANLIALESLHLSELFPNTLNLDISPLATLINLKELFLVGSGISDISPLAGLKKLRKLNLSNNQVSDFSPLTGLTELQTLQIRGNWTRDISPLAGLMLTDFQYDEVCEIAPLSPPTLERILTKNYPSIHQTFGGFFAENPEEYDLRYPATDREVYHKRAARNDLYFSSNLTLDWAWATEFSPYEGLATRVGGNLQRAREWREKQLGHNPNLVFLVQVPVQSRPGVSDFPPDTDLLLRHPDGQFVDASEEYHYNILLPKVQQLLIDRIVGIAECGLFDGVMLDGFNNNATGHWSLVLEELSVFAGREITGEDIIQIYRHIFRGVRERVRPDFLIIVNANVSRPDRYAEFINGCQMESDRWHLTTRRGLRLTEEVLSWNEENLRSPQINCLEGRALDGDSHSPENLRRMRLVTTLSLTHSDGYVDYTTHLYEGATGPRLAPWYDFWDVDLGQPIGAKRQFCDDCEGLFIREFTNGWAVYNRSGKAQKLQLPIQATGVASGITSTTHIVPDLDGEMYLKQEPGITADGTVKVLDLAIQISPELASEWMPDAALRAAVRETLELPTAIPLTKEHMLQFDHLQAGRKGISDIKGLECATNIKVLNLSDNLITDLRPIANLTTLQVLHLRNISPDTLTLDIGSLTNLINLEALTLQKNNISDISPLTNLKKLSILHLSNNNISDVSPLTGLTELQELLIKGNLVTDFSPLDALNLTELRSDVDVNDDGVVNIQDLVLVANALGKAEPDLNDDGVVNIQDLIIVANAF